MILLLNAIKTNFTREKDLHVTPFVNILFKEALDYRVHCLAGKPSRCDDEVARNVAEHSKRPRVQIESQNLDSFNAIAIIHFLSASQSACSTHDVTKELPFGCSTLL